MNNVVQSLSLVLAIAGVAGAVLAPREGYSQLGSGGVAVASILSVGMVVCCGFAVSASAKRRPWLTRFGVVAWGVLIYFVSLSIILFALPHSVASGLLKLIGVGT